MLNAKAGKFRIENGSFFGPADYMNEEGNDRLNKILAGQDTNVNIMGHLSPNLETAICVWMQTYYAAWKGAKEAESWMSK